MLSKIKDRGFGTFFSLSLNFWSYCKVLNFEGVFVRNMVIKFDEVYDRIYRVKQLV